MGLVAHLSAGTERLVPGLQPLSRSKRRFERRQRASQAPTTTEQQQRHVSWRRGCAGAAPTIRGDHRGARGAERQRNAGERQRYAALGGEGCGTENGTQATERLTARPCRR